MSICFLTPPRYLCCENFKVMISKCTLGVKSHSSPFMTTVSWLVRVPLVRNVIAFVPHLLSSCSKFLINSFFHIVYFILKVIQNERLIRIYLVFCHWLFHYLIMCEEKNLTVYNTVISSRYYFFSTAEHLSACSHHRRYTFFCRIQLFRHKLDKINSGI